MIVRDVEDEDLVNFVVGAGATEAGRDEIFHSVNVNDEIFEPEAGEDILAVRLEGLENHIKSISDAFSAVHAANLAAAAASGGA